MLAMNELYDRLVKDPDYYGSLEAAWPIDSAVSSKLLRFIFASHRRFWIWWNEGVALIYILHAKILAELLMAVETRPCLSRSTMLLLHSICITEHDHTQKQGRMKS